MTENWFGFTESDAKFPRFPQGQLRRKNQAIFQNLGYADIAA
jgi:hypothetical protein